MSSKIFDLIDKEYQRQLEHIELIASENYVSDNVLKATGSILTNKYAEGYPGNRYYGGCQVIDEIEAYTIDLAKQLFGADHANVQAHSGSSANLAAYMAVLKPQDTVLGMDLNSGGHLTHGSPYNFSGKWYNFVGYGVDKNSECIDYDYVLALAKKHQPKLIVAGASAYSRTIDFKKFKEIADEVGALLMVDMAHIAGLVAAGLHNSPVPYADIVTTTTHKTLRGPRSGLILCKKELAKSIDKAIFPGCQGGPLEHVIAAKAICFEEALRPEFKNYQQQVIKNASIMAKTFIDNGCRVVSGGSDNHLVNVDVMTSFNLTGKQVSDRCNRFGITLNKNMIPFDSQKPVHCSGIRVGSPAMTTRGFLEAEFEQIAKWIIALSKNYEDDELANEISQQIKNLCIKYPLFKGGDK